MSLDLLTASQEQASEATDDELHHVVCCFDDDLGLCGTDLSEVAFAEEGEHKCIVCHELDQTIDDQDVEEGEPCHGCPLQDMCD